MTKNPMLRRRFWREKVWKSLNAFVGLVTILNVSAVGVLIAPNQAQAITTETVGNPSADLDQCANGSSASPNTPACDPDEWVNGNLGPSKAHYFEGDSVPYRLRFKNLDNAASNSHTVTIEWDTTKGGTHALDYITTYNRTVTTANPCVGVSGCGTASTFPIPADPQVTGAGVTPIAGNFTLFGGTITGVSAYSYDDGVGFSGDKSARLTITFTTSTTNPVLAWGGHIATQDDWGDGFAAVNIPGSPYHTRLIDLDGSGGNQDRSLSADAVIFPGSITIIKQATPEGSQSFGFTSLALGNFSLTDNGTTANTKVFPGIVDFTTYATTESAIAGWSLDSIACTDPTSNSSGDVGTRTATIDLAEGENITCTFTNTRQAATVTVIKHVINDNGGTKTAGDFTMHVTGGNVSTPSFLGSESGTTVVVDPGAYSVSEDALSGYAGSLSADCTGTVAAGENKTCTITNNDIQPKLTVTKVVVNNNGGTAVISDFPLFVGTTGVTSGVQNGFNAATYTVSETNLPGYTGTISGDCAANGSITLNPGDVKSCTITNDDQGATLIVKKVVINDNGGTKQSSDFTMSIGGVTVDGTSSFPGDANGTSRGVTPGHYTVTEGAHGGYAVSYSADCDATIALGETKTCTVTNNDIQPKLTVTKVVVNNNGGTAVISDFPLFVGTTGVTSGVQNGFNAATYTVSETNLPGYTGTISGDCAANGSITLNPGDVKSCTITNDDQGATLIVKKVVINDNGGTKQPADFTLSISGVTVVGTSSFPGDANGTSRGVTPGHYTVTEGALSGYAASYSADCDATIALGETKTCTVTNDDQTGSITIIKQVIKDNGGTAVPGDFMIHLKTGGNDVIDSPAPGSTGKTYTLNAGTYAITENDFAGYTLDSISCVTSVIIRDALTFTNVSIIDPNAIGLQNGQSITCTLTNNDLPPSLTLIKHVNNDNGGTATPTEWMLTATGPTPISGPGGATSGSAFSAGEYTLSESVGPAGYFPSAWTCNGGTQNGSKVTLSVGQSATCEITNDDIAPTITLIKDVSKNNGGTAGPNDFGLTIGGTSVTSGQTLPVLANTPIALNEAGLTGYSFVNITGDAKCPSVLNGTVTLNPGENITCTIHNDDNVPHLTLVKHVTTDNGGTAIPANWTLTATGPTSISGPGGTVSGATFQAGEYTLSESAGPAGYSASAWTCTGGAQNGNKITVALGESATCDITNDDQRPHLTVIKYVINDFGVVKQSSDFTMHVSGTNPSPSSFPGSSIGTDVTLDAGSYNVTEDVMPGYDPVYSSGCQGEIKVGDTPKVCVVTNSAQAPHLIVIKHVINDNGGNNVAADFQMTIHGITVPSGATFAGSEAPGTDKVVHAGSYYVTESGPSGYTPRASEDCDGTIALGETKICTVTNNDLSPGITLTKVVNNNHGGQAGPNDFGLTIGGTPVNSGDTLPVNANTPIALNEAGLFGYTFVGITGHEKCPAVLSGTVTLNEGESIACTITNNDIQPKLTVTKVVVNDDKGTAVVSDFPLFVNATSVVSGVQNGFNAATYTVSETNLPGYTGTITGDCAANGSITLHAGDVKSCTITNDDIRPKLTVTKIVINDNGGVKTVSNFPLFVDTTSVTSGVQNGFDVGNYLVSEYWQSGYAMTSILGDCDSEGYVQLNPGDEKTCTITNNDLPGRITIVKNVINDNGGTATAGSFNIHVKNDGTDVSDSPAPGSSGKTYTLNAGTYAVSEDLLPGYALDSIQCYPDQDERIDTVTHGVAPIDPDEIQLQNGQSITCVLTNNDQPAHLTVIKHVVNDNGGVKVAGDFTMNVSGVNASATSFAGSEAGTLVTIDQGAYSVDETALPGYAKSLGANCSGTIVVGETKTCTITNDDIVSTIGLVKTATPATVAAGGNITYTLAWSVTGNNPVNNAVITDPIPANTTFVSAANGGVFGAGVVTWSLGTLAGGSSGTVSFVVKTASPIVNGTVVTNTATFDTTETPPVTSTANTPVTSAPILTIVKSNNIPTFTNPGKTVSYTVVVTNSSSATDTARGMTVTDVLPAGFTYVGGGTTKTFTVGDLAPGQSKTFSYDVVIDANQAAGTYTNTATAKASNHADVAATSKVEVRIPVVLGVTTPDLTIVKDVNTAVTKPGNNVTYTVVVKNIGDGDSVNTVLNDTLPNGLTFTDTGKRTKSWALGTLAAGQETTIAYRVHVGSSVKNGSYKNIAVVTADGVDPKQDDASVKVQKPRVLGLETTGPNAMDYGFVAMGFATFLAGAYWLARNRRREA